MFDYIVNLLRGVGNFKTAGPPDDEHPLVSVKEHDEQLAILPAFTGGLWRDAVNRPAHPGRVGPSILYKTAVVHTTDMMPDSFDALVTAWTSKGGNGACAHFLVGRDETQGVIQFVPVTKNGNHAGGPVHGNYRLASGALLHPNTVSIGIEIHGAGYLKRTPRGWLHTDSGRLVQPDDVSVDAHGRGFMVVTPYQLLVLDKLLRDLKVPGLPSGSTVAPDATYASQGVADYAGSKGPTIVGHVTLDPINKTDPGPQVMTWLREKGYC